MPFIVETPQTHPGIRLYACKAPSTGRRPTYTLLGSRKDAVDFPDQASADNAVMQFSSLLGLEVVKVQ
jgi:hypothetical protein